MKLITGDWLRYSAMYHPRFWVVFYYSLGTSVWLVDNMSYNLDCRIVRWVGVGEARERNTSFWVGITVTSEKESTKLECSPTMLKRLCFIEMSYGVSTWTENATNVRYGSELVSAKWEPISSFFIIFHKSIISLLNAALNRTRNSRLILEVMTRF